MKNQTKKNNSNRKYLKEDSLAEYSFEGNRNSRNITKCENNIVDPNNCGQVINSLTTLAKSIENNNKFEELIKECCCESKNFNKLIKVILSENEINKNIAISEGINLIVSRMKKIDQERVSLIQINQKNKLELEELRANNKKLRDMLDNHIETNKENSNTINLLKLQLQETKLKSSNTFKENIHLNCELEIKRLKLDLEDAKSNLITSLKKYKKDKEELWKEYTIKLNDYEQKENELLSMLEVYQLKTNKNMSKELFNTNKRKIDKEKSFSISIDNVLPINSYLVTKHSKYND